MKPLLALVIPCYNEEEVLPETLPSFVDRIKSLVLSGDIHEDSFVMCVDDGSRDGTWSIIRGFADKDSYMDAKYVRGIRESRNNGHQNALVAGMTEVMDKCDVVITMDCDGQDDLCVIDLMVDKYLREHVDVVYGVRSDRDSDSWFKKTTAQCYYKFMRHLGADLVYDHADCRLVSNRVLHELAGYREVNLFLRGLFPLIGFESGVVHYSRKERVAGRTHYPLGKMVSFGMDGLTSLSVKPLTFILSVGFLIAVLSFVGCVWALAAHVLGTSVPGWTSMMCIICFVCGIQLICLGMMGIYIGKIYLEVKQRPRYIICERTDVDACVNSES